MNFNGKRALLAISVFILAIIVVAGSFQLVFIISRQLAALGVIDRNKPQTARVSSLIIRGNGEVQLTGVIVESKNGNSIIATGQIGGETQTFTINVDGKTVVESGGEILDSEAIIGATLSVAGIFQSLTSGLTILAKEIQVNRVSLNFRATSVRELVMADLPNMREVPPPPPKKIALVPPKIKPSVLPEPSILSTIIDGIGDFIGGSGNPGDDFATTTTPVATTTEPVATTTPDTDTATTTEPVATSTEPAATTTEPVVEEPATTTAATTTETVETPPLLPDNSSTTSIE